MDRNDIEKHRQKGWKAIDGNSLMSEPVGYCNNFVHRGWISTVLLKGHRCLEKKCPYLDRNLEHPFWIQKAKQKRKASIGRILRKAYINGVITSKAYNRLSNELSKQKTKAGLIKVCHMIQKRNIDIPDKIYFDLIDGEDDIE